LCCEASKFFLRLQNSEDVKPFSDSDKHTGNKMMKKVSTLLLISSAAFLFGCETTSSRPYTSSTNNVLKFQKVIADSNTKIQLGNFTEGQGISKLTCRLSGPVDVSLGKTTAEYIREAMQTELFLAQVYDVDGSILINGQLESMKFSSLSPASWDLKFKVSSNKSEGYTVNTNYPFRTSYSAYSACKNVADAFGPAVQKLISDVVDHRGFKSLIGQ